MDNYFYNEKFEFLVVESFENRCYGFNLNRAAQHDTGKKIIQDLNNFIVHGYWRFGNHVSLNTRWQFGILLLLSAYVYDPAYIGPQYNKKTFMVGINMRYIRK